MITIILSTCFKQNAQILGIRTFSRNEYFFIQQGRIKEKKFCSYFCLFKTKMTEPLCTMTFIHRQSQLTLLPQVSTFGALGCRSPKCCWPYGCL